MKWGTPIEFIANQAARKTVVKPTLKGLHHSIPWDGHMPTWCAWKPHWCTFPRPHPPVTDQYLRLPQRSTPCCPGQIKAPSKGMDAGHNVHCQVTVHSPEGVKPRRCTLSKWRHLLSTPDSGGHFDVRWHRMTGQLDTLQTMLQQTFWQDANLHHESPAGADCLGPLWPLARWTLHHLGGISSQCAYTTTLYSVVSHTHVPYSFVISIKSKHYLNLFILHALSILLLSLLVLHALSLLPMISFQSPSISNLSSPNFDNSNL